jgi:hypothetical protein
MPISASDYPYNHQIGYYKSHSGGSGDLDKSAGKMMRVLVVQLSELSKALKLMEVVNY